jgi:hypothetical protein
MDKTTRVEEPTTSKDAGNVANTGVPEQVPKQEAQSRWRPSKVVRIH